jgi:hypothetical protein
MDPKKEDEPEIEEIADDDLLVEEIDIDEDSLLEEFGL